MTLCAALAPISDCTDPFRVGAELDVALWLSAIHVYGSGGRRPEIHAFADPSLSAVLHQPAGSASRPDLTFLRSTVTKVDLVERPHGEETVPDKTKTSVRVAEPLSLKVGFRRLQQGYRSIPTEVDRPIATLGFLGGMALQRADSVRVRVEEVLALDLEPLSPTFGTWRSDDVWIEGAVDVSNLDETTVLARLTIL